MKISGDVLNVLKGVAPALASTLGGPLAGAAVGFLSKKFGVKPENLEQFMLKDQATILRLKELDQEWRKFEKESGLDEMRIELQDREGARDLAKLKGMLPQVIISTIVFALYGWVLSELMTLVAGKIAIDAQLAILLGAFFGALTGAVTQIISFFFGSSRGSKEKSDAMVSALTDALRK